MNGRFFITLLAGLLTVSSLSAEPLKVASLSTVLGDIARQVGGDLVQVTEIVEPGVDPHIFEPSPGDIKKISQAQVVLASGLGFEPYLTKLQKSLGSGPVFVVVGDFLKPLLVDESCSEDHNHDHGHSHGHAVGGKIADPHWWHSIKNVEIATNVIRDAFSKADPENKAIYRKNAQRYQEQLEQLAAWVRNALAPLPRNERILVTSHDALGYFARDYGFTILPVEGISTADQPSSKKVRDLILEIKESGVPAIFAENISNPKVLQEITRETGVKTGGVLYADGLGRNEAATYDAMMRHNVSTIVNSLSKP